MPFGLYIHIPYCVSKCNYCDFYSLGHKTQVPDEYVDALIKEMHSFSSDYNAPLTPDTIYFGGGTPSLLSANQVSRLILAAAPAENAEITLEVNPETVTIDKLKGFKAAGVNRISVGVQTSNDTSLKTLGRCHNARQSVICLNMAHKAGFTNISGDLMLALPNYSFAECDSSIKLLYDNGCTHISSYILKIEPNTNFALHKPMGLPNEDEAADFYIYAVNQLEKYGYKQYEISNFAKPGYESRHNLLYWNCNNYLGLGPAAHSCIANKRFYYTSSLNEFLSGSKPCFDGNCTAQDYIMLQLRLNSGLSLKKLKQNWQTQFNSKQLEFLRLCQRQGLCTIKNNDIICLSAKGMLVQNQILCNLL